MGLGVDDLDHRRKRALYRANHRGTKEMDLILGTYAKAHLPHMQIGKLTAFEALLEVADDWLLTVIQSRQEEQTGELAPMVREIVAFIETKGIVAKR